MKQGKINDYFVNTKNLDILNLNFISVMMNHTSMETEEPFFMDNGSISLVPFFADY